MIVRARDILAQAVWSNSLDGKILYHGSKSKIKVVDPQKLQTRDYGFYGSGFYVTLSPEYARAYGPVISKFILNPGATVLGPYGLSAKEAPEYLYDNVIDYFLSGEPYRQAENRGKGKEHIEYINQYLKKDSPDANNIEWLRSAARYSKAMGADVHFMSPGEIVVFNPSVLSTVI
jgi:hypothetical protein